ncbi:MAG: aldolase/citrate lyase family protein [Candidatus Tectomicrobia bacterium]|nr:aldolase/citrate lyase family protein [Candidatus Tectomicrobia bacterium]
MRQRVNRAIALLASGQPIYYVGEHTGHMLTYEQGRQDAATWADYVNVGMEHGAFDMTGLAAYMQGLVEGGPAGSGHRTPAIIVEVPADGSSESVIRNNAWQFRQILARGVHGIVLCMAESADATRAFVESCRYPTSTIGVGRGLRVGRRGRGSEPEAAAIWGVNHETYIDLADPWPLNPSGELLLGVKIESLEGISNVEQILSVPGLGFAEMGPGDLGLAMGYKRIPQEPFPADMQRARDRVFRACRANGVAFLESCTAATVIEKIDSGVRVIAGANEEMAKEGRTYTRRAMPVWSA